jgi:predicted RNA-binding Zn-ribbon protein involved in translation (DUF1610 family)
MSSLKQYKFWLKNCPNCGHLVDAVGFNKKVSFKDAFKETCIVCPKCGAEFESVMRPTSVAKFLYKSFFPVSFLLLGASVYMHKPYSDVFFYLWGLFIAFLIGSMLDSYTLEKK